MPEAGLCSGLKRVLSETRRNLQKPTGIYGNPNLNGVLTFYHKYVKRSSDSDVCFDAGPGNSSSGFPAFPVLFVPQRTPVKTVACTQYRPISTIEAVKRDNLSCALRSPLGRLYS